MNGTEFTQNASSKDAHAEAMMRNKVSITKSTCSKPVQTQPLSNQ